MKLPFLTSLLVFIGILTFQLKRSAKIERTQEEEFWEKERRANFTRKKDINNLPYIPFDISLIPVHEELDDERISEYIAELSSLSGQKILNCTGISNTDLKLKYGAPNITKLTEYDGNYTILVRDIARLSEKYLIYASRALEDVSSTTNQINPSDSKPLSEAAANQLRQDALTLLEYGISIGTDVRLNYELLGDLYKAEDKLDQILNLIEKASKLNSLSKKPIIRYLENLLS